MTILALIVLATLLACSVFFSASETALVSLSPQKAKTLALRSPKVTAALQGWLVKPHELLTLILVGNTFVNVIFAAVLTVLFLRLFPSLQHSYRDFLSWLIGTFLIVLIGEMIPKFLARAYPEKTSLFLLPLLSKMRQIVAPLLDFLLGPMAFFFPKWKSPPVGQVLTFSLEELKSLLEEDAQVSLQDESVNMMQRILEINDRRVEQIMVPLHQVDMIEINPIGRPPRNRELLIDLIVEEGHTRTPVKLNGELAGFVHSDDLMPSLLQDRREDLTRFIRTPMYVSSDQRVSDLLQDFKTSGIHIGFVKNQNGTILGIVTLEDVLEEITGEILDEYDSPHSNGKVL